jgi:signal transduction histidine kinase
VSRGDTRTSHRGPTSRGARRIDREQIALELHDVVAHELTIVVIQAAAAAEALRGDPETARRSLLAIRRTARQGLTEMRRFLDLLVPDPAAVKREPMPSVDQLGRLATMFRTAGLPVVLSRRGRGRMLEPGVSLSVYRIVEDALDDALQIGTASAAVNLTFDRSAVTIEIEASGVAGGTAPRARQRRGLSRIRERVALYEAELKLRPQRDGSFHLWARLPRDDAAARTGASRHREQRDASASSGADRIGSESP